ncbi:cyclin-dependent kinase 4 inhibitor C-like [Haliotis asinina]|uniref:cyclin-dependent kinase 4 inhibitor C-like n=1 Tax=Haliotis asinina TaxID=109174 RepID=UPI003531CC76
MVHRPQRRDCHLQTPQPEIYGSTSASDDTRLSTADAREDLTPSTTVPPTRQDSDHHATPSPAAGPGLYSASKYGDLKRVKRILASGHVNINYRIGANTPVMVAARNGHRDVVEFLVGRGADVSLVDSGGNNILHMACIYGHLETVKLILSLEVLDINARNNGGRTAADYARIRRRQRVLDLLMSRAAH